MQNAHIRDAVAVCKWAAHMEEEVVSGTKNHTELTAVELLTKYRSLQKNYKGVSFTTVAGYGANGAIIHYTPTNETDAKISTDSLFMGEMAQFGEEVLYRLYQRNTNSFGDKATFSNNM